MKSNKLPLLFLWGLGLFAFVCLPWTALPDLGWGEVWWTWFTHHEVISGGQFFVSQPMGWVSVLPIAFLLSAIGVALSTGRQQFFWLTSGGGLGSIGLVLIALLLGAKAQSPWGVGPLVCVLVFGMLLATGLARWGAFRADAWSAGAVVLIAGFLLLFVAYPLGVLHSLLLFLTSRRTFPFRLCGCDWATKEHGAWVAWAGKLVVAQLGTLCGWQAQLP